MISSPSHVAILVPSVLKAADYFRQLGFEVEDEEIFPETREIYVQGSERNALLLLEARDTGSYRRALEKRGPGIHHLAIDVLDLDGFLDSISASGWLLHLNSLKTIKDNRTAYLARPGFPALIEVQEKNKLMDGPLFVNGVSLNFDAGLARLVKSTGLDQVVKPTRGNPFLSIQGKRIELQKLY
jgi:methylmalonyl-CoA/ethylmalonyl-CoA epimerase